MPLYRYFASKAELEVAVADEAGRFCWQTCRKRWASKWGWMRSGPWPHLSACSRKQPALYALKMRYCKDEKRRARQPQAVVGGHAGLGRWPGKGRGRQKTWP